MPHDHYFKDVSRLEKIDVYRVVRLFGVTDPAIAHALKKLLVSGGRGAGKGEAQDVQEAIDSLRRWQAMQREDSTQGAAPILAESDDPAEEAYWRFDARVKGLSEWTGRPQSERDAFKAEYRNAVHRARGDA